MSDREEYLEYELERYREEDRRRIDDEIERREQRRRDLEERYEAELRTATTWPEALRNQATLMNREVVLDEQEGYDNTDPYFADSAAACDRAVKLWGEISRTKDERRADLRAQIKQLEQALDAIDDEIAKEIGQQLLTERGDTDHKPLDGWRMIANNLIEGVDSFNNWLYW